MGYIEGCLERTNDNCKNDDVSDKRGCSGSQVDRLIDELEDMGLGWSLDHTGNLIEARVWDWPLVIGRYRPTKVEPIADMLKAAMKDAGIASANVTNETEETRNKNETKIQS